MPNPPAPQEPYPIRLRPRNPTSDVGAGFKPARARFASWADTGS